MSVALLASLSDDAADPPRFQKVARRTAALLPGAHRFFGDAFGTAYDLSTIASCGSRGASGDGRGCSNLVPRYLPPYGMTPTLGTGDAAAGAGVHLRVCFLVTILFGRPTSMPGWRLATGVLALMLSASVAWRSRIGGRAGARRSTAAMTAVFYTFVDNVIRARRRD